MKVPQIPLTEKKVDPEFAAKFQAMREEYHQKYTEYFVALLNPDPKAKEYSIIFVNQISKFHEKAIVDLAERFKHWPKEHTYIITIEGQIIYEEGKRVVDEDRWLPDIWLVWNSQNPQYPLTDHQLLQHEQNMVSHQMRQRNNRRK